MQNITADLRIQVGQQPEITGVESSVDNSQDPNQRMMQLQNHMSQVEVGDHRHTDSASDLYALQQATRFLLPDCDLKAGEVRRIGGHPVAGTSALDIWEGEYLGKEKCTVKVIRGIKAASPGVRNRFLDEVKVWRDIWEKDKGTYILPVYGFCRDDECGPSVVSPWLHNGHVLSYANKYPDVNRRSIIRGIAEGLRFLHMLPNPIAHGDVKAANILINDNGRPLLADVGLSQLLDDLAEDTGITIRGISDTFRWMAPERASGPGIATTKSDIFSYAMTVLEIMTGEQPYAHIRPVNHVLVRMQRGERPQRPANVVVALRGLDDKLWNLLQCCWVEVPHERPRIQAVLEDLTPAWASQTSYLLT